MKEIIDKSKGFATGKIFQMLFMGIRLAFKTDVLIGPVKVLTDQAPDKPFGKIPDVKENDQHFRLLPQVDAFVIDQGRILHQVFISQNDKGP